MDRIESRNACSRPLVNGCFHQGVTAWNTGGRAVKKVLMRFAFGAVTMIARALRSKPEQPVEYERDDLAEDIEYLATFPQVATARDLGLTERGWRKIIKRRPNSKAATVDRIREVAALYRSRPGQ